MYRYRIVAVTIGITLLWLQYSRERSRTVEAAARDADPAVIWSIGAPDNSGDEFAGGAVRTLTYTCGKSSPLRDWRQRQDAAEESPSVYSIHFDHFDRRWLLPKISTPSCVADESVPG